MKSWRLRGDISTLLLTSNDSLSISISHSLFKDLFYHHLQCILLKRTSCNYIWSIHCKDLSPQLVRTRSEAEGIPKQFADQIRQINNRSEISRIIPEVKG